MPLKHVLASVAIAASALLTVACGSTSPSAPPSASSPVTLEETGSTLLYPLFNIWAPAYHNLHKSVRISTGATGSGTGISSAEGGTVEIGASDAYMSQAQLQTAPGTVLNIPLAISAQVIAYNLPGVKTQLTLSGPVLAGIYSGAITNWNDPKIAALNPGVTLPNLTITPVHRTDASGDSFIFTQYLSFSTPSWNSSVGYSTNPTFPAVKTAVGAEGNSGVVQSLDGIKGGIGYVGISYLSSLKAGHLAYAKLVNKAGNAVEPTASTISAAAEALVPTTPSDERLSLVFAPGANAYPIINYEYAIVRASQSSAGVAQAVRDFLDWAVTKGNAPTYLNQVNFIPLPSSVVSKSEAQIAKIH